MPYALSVEVQVDTGDDYIWGWEDWRLRQWQELRGHIWVKVHVKCDG